MKKFSHSQRPKNGGGGGDATTQPRNSETLKKEEKKLKIQSDNGESRERDPSDSRPNAHPMSKFNSTEQQHVFPLTPASKKLSHAAGRCRHQIEEE
jgi:hypothetical protein